MDDEDRKYWEHITRECEEKYLELLDRIAISSSLETPKAKF